MSRNALFEDLLAPLRGRSRGLRVASDLVHLGLPLLAVGVTIEWLFPVWTQPFAICAGTLLLVRGALSCARGHLDPGALDRRLGLGDRLRTAFDIRRRDDSGGAFGGWLRRDLRERLQSVQKRTARSLGWRPLGKRRQIVAVVILALLLLRVMTPWLPNGLLPVGGIGERGEFGRQAEADPDGDSEADPPPTPPTDLTATIDRIRVDLDWADHPEEDVVGYRLYRAELPSQRTEILNGGEPPPLFFYPLALGDEGGLLRDSEAVDVRFDYDAHFRYYVTAVDERGRESEPSEVVGVPDSAGGNGPRDKQEDDPDPGEGGGSAPPDPDPEQPPPGPPPGPLLDDIPSRIDFVAPTFVGDGPAEIARGPAIGLDETPAETTTDSGTAGANQPLAAGSAQASGGSGGEPPEPEPPEFERARERALSGRHVRPDERDFVRQWFQPRARTAAGAKESERR